MSYYYMLFIKLKYRSSKHVEYVVLKMAKLNVGEPFCLMQNFFG